jgi:hypothetical protein
MTLRKKTFRKTTLSTTTLSATTFSLTTLSLMTIGTTTIEIVVKFYYDLYDIDAQQSIIKMRQSA